MRSKINYLSTLTRINLSGFSRNVFLRRDALLFLALCGTWSLLYLPHLRTVPSWYGDEGLALCAGLNLVSGIPAHGSFWNTFWNHYAPYQPFYELAIGGMAQLFGGDILGGRIFNACIGLAVSLVLCFYGRRIMPWNESFGAALLFLTFEQSVIHFRWIFTHNLIALGFAIAFLGLSGKSCKKSERMAGWGLGISALSLPLSIYGIIGAALIQMRFPRTWLRIFAPYIFLTTLSLLIGWLLFFKENFLLNDLRSTLEFYTNASRENGGGGGFLRNFLIFFSQDSFHFIGLLMLCLCLFGNSFPIGAGGLIVAFLLLQNRQNLVVFYYQAIILLPFITVAYGVGFGRIGSAAKKYLPNFSSVGILVSHIPLLLAGIFFVCLLPQSLQGRLSPRIAYWTTQSCEEVAVAAGWINERTSPKDLVICHQNIAWLIHARTADYLQVASWMGLSTWPFKNPLPKAQFRFEPDLTKAKFAIIGDIDQRWTILQPNIAGIMKPLTDGSWKLVWRGENYYIFENPDLRLLPR